MTTAHERKQQERHARRRRIQRAARTVFAEKGYAKTSIEQIAREASLSVGAIYLYFRSKEDLYVSLLEETLETFDSDIQSIIGSSEPADARLKGIWNYLGEWAQGDIEATRVLRLASQPGVRKQLSDEVADSVGKGLTRIREQLATLITEGSSSSVYGDIQVDHGVDLIWSLLLGVLQANDARLNLGLPGGDFASLTGTAWGAVEATLRAPVTNVHHHAA